MNANSFEVYTPPLLHAPGIIRRLQQAAGEVGVAAAVAELFSGIGITVEVAGDMTEWDEVGEGALWYGNHREGMEPAGLLALLGTLGREDVHMFGKPPALQARVLDGIKTMKPGLPDARHLLLPVYPPRMARDRPPKELTLRDRYLRRKIGPQHLPDSQQLATINEQSQQQAIDYVEQGHVCIIFPTGKVAEAHEQPWRNGIGRMAVELANRGSEMPLIPFQFDPISRRRLAAAFVRRELGLRPKPYTMILRVAEPMRPQDVVADARAEWFAAQPEPDSPPTTDQLITATTALMQKRFIDYFDAK